MGEYDISQWRLAGTWIHTPSDPKMATGVRTGFTTTVGPGSGFRHSCSFSSLEGEGKIPLFSALDILVTSCRF